MAIDFGRLAEQLLAHSTLLVPAWLPTGHKIGTEWAVGNLAGAEGESLKINLERGVWKDFATGEGGSDLISLYAAIHHLEQSEAAKRLSASNASEAYYPVKPNGQGTAFTGKHGSHGEPIALHEYTDRAGELLYYIARYENEKGKSFLPWTYDGAIWRAKGWPPPRPLYGLALIDRYPASSILLVEGELKCDRARVHLSAEKQAIVISWCGGAQSWRKTDWLPLAGRKVILWPDADAAGREAMALIAQKLIELKCSATVLEIQSDRSEGWDIADFIRENHEAKSISGAIQRFVREHQAPIAQQSEDNRPKRDWQQERGEIELISDLWAKTIEPAVALVEGMLYPGAWLLVGRPKIGKSWLLMQLALAVSQQGASTFLGSPCRRSEVLYVASEDNEARLKSRLQALGCACPPEGVYVLTRATFMALAASHALKAPFVVFLDEWLERHRGVGLVLLDTEASVRQIWDSEQKSDVRVIESDYKQTRVYDELALRRGIVIVLVNHASKRKGAEKWIDIHELINRSNTAFAGCSGSIALADPPDADPLDTDNRTRVLGIRGRDLADDLLIAVHQEKEMPYFVRDGVYKEVRQSQVEQEILEALESLMLDIEEGSYVTAAAIAEVIGVSRGAIQRAITRMLVKGRRSWKQWRLEVKRGKGGGCRLDKI